MSSPFELYTRNTRPMPPRIPQARHRDAAPSGPWPFLDLRDNEMHPVQLVGRQTPPTLHPQHWTSYPASLFPDWTSAQWKNSGISRLVDHVSSHRYQPHCTIHHVNVLADGSLAADADEVVTEQTKAAYWETLTKKPIPDNVRLRVLFLDNLTGPVLQMLGTKYNIDPLFFSSSLNWIPSHYQEGVGSGSGTDGGDHITITLTFIRSMQNPMAYTEPTPDSADQVIDTQAPLALSSSNTILLPDILALHLIRHPDPTQSTLLSYHSPHTHCATSAGVLRSRLLAAGGTYLSTSLARSVYWNRIFASTVATDPTFVLLTLLWYPLYAFEEALEALYMHICWLESRAMVTIDVTLTQQWHIVHTHLLHYASLLEDFRECVVFVANTPNPNGNAVSPPAPSPETSAFVTGLMRKESTNLLAQIARLERSRSMLDSRLKNIMDMANTIANLDEYKHMHQLTKAALRDSSAMKQIAYLTMVFLPASFTASVFGMNVQEITPGTRGTLLYYIAFALPLTAVTIWIIMVFRCCKRDLREPVYDDWAGPPQRRGFRGRVRRLINF
ncbi:hypothetical protein C8J57DRAFT_1192045 [Mycena rebaudengoi]|nr:hypothetical protein C8J57DRAFT_1192045 [Mycena rebaudengoi]